MPINSIKFLKKYKNASQANTMCSLYQMTLAVALILKYFRGLSRILGHFECGLKIYELNQKTPSERKMLLTLY
jgi:hypothetical protein